MKNGADDPSALVRGIAWGVVVRPALRARDLALLATQRGGAPFSQAYRALWKLERALPPHRASPRGEQDAAARGLPSSSLTWGETPFATAVDVLRRAGVTSSSTVLDLGAGRGMVLLAARFLGAQARGVEIDPMRAEPAREILASVGAVLDVGDARACSLDGATHVWLAWTCMPDDIRASLSERVAGLPAGTTAIALTWPPPSSTFAEVSTTTASFSWGRATVIIKTRR